MLPSIDETTSRRFDSVKSNATLRPARYCPSCHQICSRTDRSLIRALGEIYHYHCFTCADCNTLVADKFYALDQDGQFKIVCEKHYHARLQPCAHCQERPCRCRPSSAAVAARACPGCRTTTTTSMHPHGADQTKDDLYLAYDNQHFCLFHYAALDATHCIGCDQAILKQFVEHKQWPNKKWHPECYMIFKFWNVRLRDTVINDDPPSSVVQVKARLQRMEKKVSRIWTDLSTFEESSATCLSEMLLLVASSAYMDGFRMASQFIMHLQVLFAALEAVRHHDDHRKDDFEEARTTCRHVIRFFALLAHQESGAAADTALGVTQELLSLVTQLAQGLKVLIRLGLTEALQQEQKGKDPEAIDTFLKNILELEKKRIWIGGKFWFKDDAFHHFLATMTTSPLLLQSDEAKDPRCFSCQQAITADAYQISYERWHPACAVCADCGVPVISDASKKATTVRFGSSIGLLCNACHDDALLEQQEDKWNDGNDDNEHDDEDEEDDLARLSIKSRRHDVKAYPLTHLSPLQHELYLVKLALLRFYNYTLASSLPVSSGGMISPGGLLSSAAAGITTLDNKLGSHLEQGSPQPTKRKKTNNVTILSPRWLRVTTNTTNSSGQAPDAPSLSPASSPVAAANGISSPRFDKKAATLSHRFLRDPDASPLRTPAALFGSIDLGNIKRAKSTSTTSQQHQKRGLHANRPASATLPRRAHTIHPPSYMKNQQQNHHESKQLPPLPPPVSSSSPKTLSHMPSRIVTSPMALNQPPITNTTTTTNTPASPTSPASPAKRTMSTLRRAWSLRKNSPEKNKNRASIYSLFDQPPPPASPDHQLAPLSPVPPNTPPGSAITAAAVPLTLLHATPMQYHLIRHFAAQNVHAILHDWPLDDLFALISTKKSTKWSRFRFLRIGKQPSAVAASSNAPPRLQTTPLSPTATADPSSSSSSSSASVIKSFNVPLAAMPCFALSAIDRDDTASALTPPARNRATLDWMLDACTTPTCKAPAFVRQLLVALLRSDLTVEGIFRKNGNIRELKQLEILIDDSTAADPHASHLAVLQRQTPVQLAALLKRFLRELPEPLLTDRFYPLFLVAIQRDNEQERHTLLHLICAMLPKENRDTIHLVFGLLHHVASCDGNRMDAYNLARVFAPNILYTAPNFPRAPDNEIMVIEAMIRCHDAFAKVMYNNKLFCFCLSRSGQSQ
ncbi:hypothetical protein BC940DRAFT_287860 [Gongronella butleri]|nr:hypothetical protein BC940DRAFT_287860 [Gongronella butleri]